MTVNNNIIEEYKDLSNNMRHYANMRFAQLTIFFALTSGLIWLIFSNDNRISSFDNHKYILKIAGALLTILFWIMEERSGDKWHNFKRQAIKLEVLLGYRQYTDDSVKKYDPSELTNYLYDLAKAFSLFYEKLPIIKANDKLKKARLLLINNVRMVLGTGLDLLGIEAPEKM